jgi:3-oxoadipate enol-lactonase
MKSGKIRRINTRIGELAVHEHGGGDETIVFWPALYTDHRMYAQQVAAFSDSYRLLVIDPPGHGASPAPCDLVSMPDCAEAVIEVLDAYGLQKVHWVGTSWGGIVGAHLGAAHPERFESLLLANTPFDHGDPSALRGAKFVVGLAQIFGGSSVFGKGVARSFFPDPGKMDKAKTAVFLAGIASQTRKSLTIAGKSVLIERDSLLPLLPSIKVQTMVVAGGKDKLYPQEGLRNAAALIPGAEFYLAAGSGHLSAFEAPVEFNRMLSNWIGGR